MRESQIRLYRSDPEFEDYKDSMQFRLTYVGSLKPSGNNSSRGTHKHEIRKQFHPQLKSLWAQNPNLKGIGEANYKHFVDHEMPVGQFYLDNRTVLEAVAANNPLRDYNFVPLVSNELSLTCGIEVLFLRCGTPGEVLKGGDIDNRIKTLLDALKRPTQLQDIGDPYVPPETDEKPFFVLLEDDALVSKLSVETDTLLEPVVWGIPDDYDCRLVITVTVRPTITTFYNLALG